MHTFQAPTADSFQFMFVNPSFCAQQKVRMQLESCLANVSVVQSCVHLIQDEEGSGAEAEGHQRHRTSNEGQMLMSDRLFFRVLSGTRTTRWKMQHVLNKVTKEDQICYIKLCSYMSPQTGPSLVKGLSIISQRYLWMANNRARAAMAFSPPDRLSMAMKRFPGATQL